jgi:BASS family bile acid:Na+ symporter
MEFIDFLIGTVLALIMFGIGSSLKLSDFREIFRHPKSLGIGLTLQMVFLPILFFIIALLSPFSPELKVGLFIIALRPGGTTSNFITYIVGANVALCIALTSLNSFLILLTIPTLTNLSLHYFMEVDQVIQLSAWETIVHVFLIVLLPALLGLMFNRTFPKTSEKLQRPLKYINTLLLAGVFAIKFLADQSSGGSGISGDEIFFLLPLILLAHLIAVFFSYFSARFFRLDNLKATTISIEVGLQNTTLALLITNNILQNNEMTKPALVYALFSFFTTLLFAYLFQRYGEKILKRRPSTN